MKVPDILYKYMTADTAKIVLETKKLRWQSPDQFNDIHELQRMPVLSPCSKKDNRNLEDGLRQLTESYNDGSLRFFCLTENENDELMWAHYGESHKGCIFGFKHIEKLSTPFLAAEKVTYSANTPVVGSIDDVRLCRNTQQISKNTRLAK
jgi:hypothetical protein